jgi:multiple sugar transport system substrate-binding protein
MTSPEAMKAHVKNGFPIVPRFAVSADPEATASSPIVRFVDRLARRNLLHTWQRPPLPQYSAIERVLGEEIHDALIGVKSDQAALRDASARVERILCSTLSKHDGIFQLDRANDIVGSNVQLST